jgi:inhibitor of cysteine peptidase
MKINLLFIIYSALVIVLVGMFTVGCQSNTDGKEIEIRPAPIHEVQVNIAESFPPQVFVYIKGGLADSCTTFHELKTERSGNTINITVTTQRPKDAICAQVYGFFEKNVNLGSDFTSGETYTINVNDKTTSFVMQ